MNLTWNIIRKDLRQHRVVVGLWLLAVVTEAIVIAVHFGADDFRGDFRDVWETTANAALIFGWVLTLLLSVQIVLSDLIDDDSTFWKTRPISRRRLLNAKATLLASIVLLPVLLYIVVVAAQGLSFVAVLAAAIERGLARLVIITATAAIAATCRGLNGVIVRTLAAVLAMYLAMSFLHPVRARLLDVDTLAAATHNAQQSALLVAQLLAAAIATAVVSWQYLRGHSRAAISGIYLGGILATGVYVFWPWDFLTRGGKAHASLETPVAYQIRSSHLVLDTGRLVPSTTISLDSKAQPDGTVVVPRHVALLKFGEARTLSGLRRLTLQSADVMKTAQRAPQLLEKTMGVRVLNLPAPAALDFSVVAPTRVGPALTHDLEAQVPSRVCEYQIDYEIPAQVGAHVRTNATSANVREFSTGVRGRAPGTPNVQIIVHEVNVKSPLTGKLPALHHGMHPLLARTPFVRAYFQEPVYLLLNRTRKEAILAMGSGHGADRDVYPCEIVDRHARFPLSALRSDAQAWLADAKLVRVSLVELAPAAGSLHAQGITVERK